MTRFSRSSEVKRLLLNVRGMCGRILFLLLLLFPIEHNLQNSLHEKEEKC